MARVLVVDDSDDLRNLIEIRLRQSGHKVVSADSGEAALTLLADRGAPDIAVLDVLMPGMTGLELCARMREDPAFATVPVIFLSGRVLPADVAAGRELGAIYLTKPFVVSALNQAIERSLLTVAADAGSW